MIRFTRVLLTLALTLAPSAAFADGFFSVGIGSSSGGFLTKSQRTYPWQLGAIKHDGWVGFEGEYSSMVTPGAAPNARTLGASVIIGKRVSAWRPYGTIGWATLGSVVDISDTIKITGARTISNKLITFGGGLMGELISHLGVQVDVRVFRDLTQTAGLTRVQFTRAAASVYVKF